MQLPYKTSHPPEPLLLNSSHCMASLPFTLHFIQLFKLPLLYIEKNEKRGHPIWTWTILNVVYTREITAPLLDGEVGKSYLSQLLWVLMKLFQDGKGLLLGAVLKDTLDHPAAIRVSGQNKHLQNTNTQRSKNKSWFQIYLEHGWGRWNC